MALDPSKYKYKVGDKVKKVVAQAEYEIVQIQHISNSFGDISHYKLKSCVSGCKDSPFWISSFRLYDQYEPTSPMLKILFDDRGSEATVDPRVAHERALLEKRGLGGD